MNHFYYMLFFGMVFVYLISNKYCSTHYKVGEHVDPEEKDTLVYRFCANRDGITLNAGSGFLAFAAFRAFYNRINRRIN